MSLYGALYSGVSGLAAQSSAMGAIADNITNVNTTGYKGTSVNFQTLVTKQTSLTTYSAGGAQPKPRADIDVQGLLSATSSSTDVGISGNGFFVVNEAANPGSGNVWGYTRAGSFKLDDDGYLKNVGGNYLQAWPLMTYDGSTSASLVSVGSDVYMKAYQDSAGNTTYVNDNIIDSTNLKPVNLNTIGGTATQTQNIRMGANLPASDPVFSASDASAGGRHSLSVLIFDSLGNSHNLNTQYTKTEANAWSMNVDVPSGAGVVTVYDDRETTTDAADDVYAARGQIELSQIPSYGETISITDGAGTYTFEFTNGGGATGTNVEVDISTATAISDVISALKTQIDLNLRDSDRFSADGSKLDIIQSAAGDALTIDASNCLSCPQSQINPNATTGIPTGSYSIPAIDDEIKNVAKIDFDVNPTAGDTLTINGTTITFGTTVAIGATPEATVTNLKSYLDTNITESGRFIASGRTLNIQQSSTGADITVAGNMTGNIFYSKMSTDGAVAASNTWATSTISKTFTFNGVANSESGYMSPAIRFNADGTPKYFNVDSLEIEWANGAENMQQTVKNGQSVDLRIDLFLGNTSTADGFTHLSGDFSPNYITQDGAKFGNYAGVSIGEDGLVTALFDNGETRAIAQIPLATFVNPNGMEARTGNMWIETDVSGQPTVRTAGQGGAGTVNSASLESSTVDIGTEFTNMITTQRAYSASSKVITSANDMLDDLLRVIR